MSLSSQKCVVICMRVRQKCEKGVISFELLDLGKQNLVLLMVLFCFAKIERIKTFKFVFILLPSPVMSTLLMT